MSWKQGGMSLHRFGLSEWGTMSTVYSNAARRRSFWCSIAATAALGLTMLAPASSVHAQAPPLGTVATFAVLAGSTVTNVGPTVLGGTAANPGNLGLSPGSAVVGFPPGILTGPGATIHISDAIAIQAQVDLTNAYNILASRPATANLTGQNLGGLTLTPGVYSFSSAAQLTGALTLNGLGNPNAVFIFNIGSSLTTASASVVNLVNNAQGGNVFWRVGSSATLGTTTSFVGDILANTSITLNTGAKISCGAAWASTGAVTLDTNTIALCDLIAAAGGGGGGGGGAILGPTGVPLIASLLPSVANDSQRAVATAIDTFVARGGALPVGFLGLFNLSPADLANALTQIQGETGTGFAQAGVQAMNSFLSLVTNPYADYRGFAPESPPPRPAVYYKAPVYKAMNQAVVDPRRWSIWAAGYGGQSNLNGYAAAGSHDLTARAYGFATGLDYRVTPNTIVGFALGGGGTNFGLANGLGGGRSDMFQAAIYGLTRFNAAYVSAALAYGWHQASTDRVVTVAGLDQLTADFSANNIGGRIEGGYRFALPGVLDLTGFGLTPYAALQMQAFRTPSYSETAVSGSSVFALRYDAHTTTVIRTELGAWFDRPFALDDGAILSLRSRAAWAHDDWSDLHYTPGFLSLPGSSWTETGAPPARDLLLASAVAEVSFRNGISLAGKFDTELSPHSQTYIGTARLRYSW
jgi:uncharacterized protein with beta-barrel porin domain